MGDSRYIQWDEGGQAWKMWLDTPQHPQLASHIPQWVVTAVGRLHGLHLAPLKMSY